MAALSGLFKKWRKQPMAMYRCNICFSTINEGERRYCCMECVVSYDLCSKCCKAGKDREHTQQMGRGHQFTLETRSDSATSDLVKSNTLEDNIRNWFLYYAQRHACGSYNSATDSYDYLTYKEVGQLVRTFASGVQQLVIEKGAEEQQKTKVENGGEKKKRRKGKDRGGVLKGKVASICGPACLEWYVADFTFLLMGVVNAPITVTADRETIDYVLHLTEVEVVVCAPHVLDSILSVVTSGAQSCVNTIIVMDNQGQASSAVASGASSGSGSRAVRVVRYSEVLQIGNQHLISDSKWKHFSHDPNDIFTIAFTSGSTGQPKGCVFSRATWHNRMSRSRSFVGRRRVWLSYHPPSHNLERGSVYNTLNVGGKVAFYRGSMEHLLDDYALVRPTIVSITPRFWNMIYNQYLQAVQIAYQQYLTETPPDQQVAPDLEGGDHEQKKPEMTDERVNDGDASAKGTAKDGVEEIKEAHSGEKGTKQNQSQGGEPTSSDDGAAMVQTMLEDETGKKLVADVAVARNARAEHSGEDGMRDRDRESRQTAREMRKDDEEKQPPTLEDDGMRQSSERGDGKKGHANQLHPQLSHLSSFDGEDNDYLDDNLPTVDHPPSIKCLPPPSHVTPEGRNSAEATSGASDDDYQEKAFDIRNVPFDVRYRVMEEFKGILGGRETAVVTGGAPTSEAVKKFIMTCFGGIPSEGYGATEVGGIASNGKMHPMNEFKLLDVPEMGYLTTDKPPRGELCVKTPNMISGYYKNEQEMTDKFIDGYFRTGDIVVMEDEGKVTIIDRKKNLFKLAQGEFVSPERLENLYTVGSSMINQTYIYGNSLQSNIVGVVVPHADSLQRWWAEHNPTSEAAALVYEDLCQKAEVHHLYLSELSSIATSQGLQGWEVPADILVEPVPFSLENGLLTAIQKKSRPRLERKYRSALEQLYAKMNANQGSRPLEVRIMEFLMRRAQNTTNQPSLSDDSSATATSTPSGLAAYSQSTITQLGGDSLTAMRLSALLKEHMNIDISAQTALTLPLGRLLESVGLGEGGRTTETRSIDWEAESSIKFLETYLHQDKKRSPLDNESGITVLLTGATGFLGRFILLALLQKASVGRVYCIVKRKNDTAAPDRVATILSQLCSELSLEVSYHHKLEVMEGDLAQERLGLASQSYATLCSNVDVVIHNGAVVNAALPYASLKGPNVDGTKAVLQIVCEGRPKILHYVSTMGVFSGQSRTEEITETTQPQKERLSRISGYSQSKWVGETMVLKAMEQGLVHGSISRPGLIGAHSSTGHANLQDWPCWLVRGLARMGRCPVGPGCDDKVIYCVPVEQVASAVVFFSLDYRGSDHVFHLVNNCSPLRYNALGDAVKTLLCPSLTTCDYAEFRSRLSILAGASADSILSSLDLLLPRAGGWATSHAHSNTATLQACEATGVRLNSLPDDYLDKYIGFIGTAFGEKCHIAK